MALGAARRGVAHAARDLTHARVAAACSPVQDGRMRTVAAVAAVAVSFAALPACSSSYIPQARGRVSMMLMNGSFAYVRDGRVYPHGFLGSGLVKAVRGNAAAERAAREYHDRQRDGLLVGAGGLVCSVLSTAAMAHDLSGQQAADGSADEFPSTGWLALGCLVAGLAGLGYIATAEPYRYDAINIFNDTTPAWTPAAPGAYAPYGGAAAAPSLRMRD